MDKREYLRQYYIKNKERLNEAKKLRYRTDPEYKKRILQTARDHKVSLRYVKFPTDPSGYRLRPLKEICLLLKRNYEYMSRIAKKYFPPPYKRVGTVYYYTKAQTELLQFVFSLRGLPYSVVSPLLHRFWNESTFRKEEVRLYADELKRQAVKKFKEQSSILSRDNTQHGELRECPADGGTGEGVSK